MQARVILYTTDYCPYCVRAKHLLTQKGVSYEEIDVSDRPELRTWLANTTRQQTVPQIFINDKPVGGFTDLAALQRAGTLDGLLSTAPIGPDTLQR
jgi:glutaredoxin 3